MAGRPGKPLPARELLPGDGGREENTAISNAEVFQRHGERHHWLSGIAKSVLLPDLLLGPGL